MNIYKVLNWLTLVIAIFGLFLPTVKFLGASISTSYDLLNTIDGYQVDNTTVIDGDGEWVGNVENLVYGDANGALPGITFGSDKETSTTLTAAQVCDNSVLDVTNTTSTANTPSLAHVPSAANVFADCLTAIGDTRDFVLFNGGATSSITLSNALAVNSASTSLMYADFASSTVGTGTATSSIDVNSFAKVKMFRFTSSSQAWLGYMVQIFR